ncbi:MAG: right-handed parallel beta-helix repeat-containing protein, partial [Methylocella sp.]
VHPHRFVYAVPATLPYAIALPALRGRHSMTKITSLLQAIAGALLACGLSAAPAQAGPNRTFVSGTGTDSGTCTRAAPCLTFAFALTQTNAGGEIDVLDPADYGPVIIGKAISIVNDGVGVASIGVSSGNAITINVGPNDSVHLSGLTIDGFGVGVNSAQNGILFNKGGNLAIENCVVRGFFIAGINIEPRTNTPSSVSVSNTIASNNGRGIIFVPIGSAAVKGVLSNVKTNNNFNGILVNGETTTGPSLNVTIVDSESSNNGFFGVSAVSASGNAPTAVMLRNSVAINNGFGLVSDNNAILRVVRSVVTGNAAGVAVGPTGGMLDSYGDNDIDGNTTNNTGVLTEIPTN